MTFRTATEEAITILDAFTQRHLRAWCQGWVRADEDGDALAEQMQAFCDRHAYDPCAQGTDWPTVLRLMEREVQS